MNKVTVKSLLKEWNINESYFVYYDITTPIKYWGYLTSEKMALHMLTASGNYLESDAKKFLVKPGAYNYYNIHPGVIIVGDSKENIEARIKKLKDTNKEVGYSELYNEFGGK